MAPPVTSGSNGLTMGLDPSLLQQQLLKAQTQFLVEQQQRLSAMNGMVEKREPQFPMPTSSASALPAMFPPTSSALTDAERQIQLQQYLSQMPSPLALLSQCQPVIPHTAVCRE